jgi:hypothetical protein
MMVQFHQRLCWRSPEIPTRRPLEQAFVGFFLRASSEFLRQLTGKLGHDLGDGFPDGVCISCLTADSRLGEAAENELVRLAVHEVNYQHALGVLLHLGIHRPRAVVSKAGDRHASTGQDVKFLARYDSRNDEEAGILARSLRPRAARLERNACSKTALLVGPSPVAAVSST